MNFRLARARAFSGIQFEEPPQIDGREQQIAEFAFQTVQVRLGPGLFRACSTCLGHFDRLGHLGRISYFGLLAELL